MLTQIWQNQTKHNKLYFHSYLFTVLDLNFIPYRGWLSESIGIAEVQQVCSAALHMFFPSKFLCPNIPQPGFTWQGSGSHLFCIAYKVLQNHKVVAFFCSLLYFCAFDSWFPASLGINCRCLCHQQSLRAQFENWHVPLAARDRCFSHILFFIAFLPVQSVFFRIMVRFMLAIYHLIIFKLLVI